MSEFRAVYGTLKAGFGNHRAFQMDKPNVCRLIWKGRISGYNMWKAAYPFVKRGTGEISIEVYEFYNEQILHSIDKMEINAGYQLELISIPELPSKSIYMYLYSGDISSYTRVLNGIY